MAAMSGAPWADVGRALEQREGVYEGALAVGELPIGVPLWVPFVVVRGGPGPVLWVAGAVHGDEFTGPAAMLRLARALTPGRLRGALVCTPVANPLAFLQRRKVGEWDFQDLHQLFPGRAAGLVTQRLAGALFEAIRQVGPAALVDLHTMGSAYDSLPYAVYKVYRGLASQLQRRVEALLQAFDTRCVCRVELGAALGELPGAQEGALDYNGLQAGIPSFMVELGGGGQVDPQHLALAVGGLLRVMVALGMLDQEEAAAVALEAGAGVARQGGQRLSRRRRHITCDRGGLFYPAVLPGQLAPAGATLGRVEDLWGRTVEEIRTAEAAYVLGVRRGSPVMTGDRVAFLAFDLEPFGAVGGSTHGAR